VNGGGRMIPISAEELSGLTTEQKRALLKRLLLEKADASSDYQLSYGQQAFWFIHKLRPDSAAYNIAVSARLRRSLDTSALRRSLAQLVERHAALRTIVIETESGPIQRASRLATVDFREVDAPSGDQHVREQVIEEYRRPFVLGQPLFRVTLFQVPDRSQILLFSIHHLVFDAGSTDTLIDDLCKFYEAQTQNIAADPPPPQAQYSEFVSWQRQLLSSPEADRLFSYWANALAGPPPPLQFPPWPSGLPIGVRSASIPASPNAEAVANLRQLARSHNATVYMVMLAAFQVLLHRYTRQNDIVIGSPTGGRTQTRWSGVIGNFINMLPIRSDLSDNPVFSAHLACTRETVLKALAHQELPFPLMLERLRLSRSQLGSPLFQVLFNFVSLPPGSSASQLFREDAANSGVPFGATMLEPFPIPQQEGQFGLVLEAMEADGKLTAQLRCSPDGPDPELASTMAADYLSLLTAAVSDPGSRIGSLALPRLDASEMPRDVILL